MGREACIQRFVALDAAGREYEVEVWQRYDGEVEAMKELRCRGDIVQILAKGSYRLVRAKWTDGQDAVVDLFSSDPAAP